MTLKLAAFQHFCARFADAFLTSLNPLTYERGDALQAFEEENEVHEPAEVKRCWDADCVLGDHGGWHMDDHGCSWGSAKDFHDSEVAASPAASAHPAAVDDAPPVSPAAGICFVDYMTPAIEDVLAVHLPEVSHSDGTVKCFNPFGIETMHMRCADWQDWREHVAPLIAERIERSGGKR